MKAIFNMDAYTKRKCVLILNHKNELLKEYGVEKYLTDEDFFKWLSETFESEILQNMLCRYCEVPSINLKIFYKKWD